MSTKGVPQLQSRLQAVASPATKKYMLNTWRIRTVAGAKIRAPKRSGHLKQTIHPGVLEALRATVEVSAVYAAAHEFGSGIHGKNHAHYIIKPVKGKWLAWGGARRLTGSLRTGAQATNFARVVKHPGVKATPYLLPAAQEAQVKGGLDAIVIAWNNAA